MILDKEVIIDINCVRDTKDPILIHNKTKKLSYHKRIQKKWIKRFGMVQEPCAYEINNKLIVHPVIHKKLVDKSKESLRLGR